MHRVSLGVFEDGEHLWEQHSKLDTAYLILDGQIHLDTTRNLEEDTEEDMEVLGVPMCPLVDSHRQEEPAQEEKMPSRPSDLVKGEKWKKANIVSNTLGVLGAMKPDHPGESTNLIVRGSRVVPWCFVHEIVEQLTIELTESLARARTLDCTEIADLFSAVWRPS